MSFTDMEQRLALRPDLAADRARLHRLYIVHRPTACPLRGYGRAGTQNDRLAEHRHARIRAMGMPSAMPR